jgi:hypothetical protein
MMKRVALLTLAALISLGTAAYSVRGAENQEDILTVNNWKGKHIGIVQYVLVDPSTGNLAFVILYLKDRKKEIALPLAAFSSYDREHGTLTLKFSEKVLLSAPEFHDSDLNDPAFAEEVYRFFDLVPSWTDETEEEGKRM